MQLIRPTLNLDFDNTDQLDPRVTFTRSSSAGRFNKQGIYEMLPANAPRFDYAPVDSSTERAGQCRGLLIEEQRTNLLTYSEQFDNAAWAKAGGTVISNQAVSPDGVQDADVVVENTSGTTGRSVNHAFTSVSGTAYTFSIYVKEVSGSEKRYVSFILHTSQFGSYLSALFDVSTGATYQVSAGVTVGSQSVGNGWRRVWATATATAAATVSGGLSARICGSTSDPFGNYTGDGTSGLYFWGAQLEVGTFPTSYIPTTTTSVTRSADIATVSTLSPWFNTMEGTVVAEVVFNATLGSGKYGAVVQFENGGASERFAIKYNPNNFTGGFVASSSTIQVDMNQLITVGSVSKITLAVATNNFAGCLNGGSVVTDTAGVTPSGISRMTIGNNLLGVFGSQHIRKVRYFPKRLSNDQLQSITI